MGGRRGEWKEVQVGSRMDRIISSPSTSSTGKDSGTRTQASSVGKKRREDR